MAHGVWGSLLLFQDLRLPKAMAKYAHKAEEGIDTHWSYPIEWLAPVVWYYKHMQFPKEGENGWCNSVGISWLELMIDFVCATHINIIPAGNDTKNINPYKTQDLFAAVSKRVFV